MSEIEAEKKSFPWMSILPVLLFGALALVFLKGLNNSDQNRKLPSVLIGKPAPQFDLKPIEGLAVPVPGLKTADLKQGQVTVVNFWASWCIPCRQEHPNLIELGKMSGKEGFKLVGINYKDKPKDAARFLRQLGSSYAAIGSDYSGRVGIDWGVVGVPETYIVDGKGVITYKFIGPISQKAMMEDLLPKIREAMGKK